MNMRIEPSFKIPAKFLLFKFPFQNSISKPCRGYSELRAKGPDDKCYGNIIVKLNMHRYTRRTENAQNNVFVTVTNVLSKLESEDRKKRGGSSLNALKTIFFLYHRSLSCKLQAQLIGSDRNVSL